MTETNLQAFVRALYEAHDASKVVDSLDLRSEDDVSVHKWERLQEIERPAFCRLHEVCRRVPVEDLMEYD